jgi:hypothetical protein
MAQELPPSPHRHRRAPRPLETGSSAHTGQVRPMRRSSVKEHLDCHFPKQTVRLTGAVTEPSTGGYTVDAGGLGGAGGLT